MKIIKVLVNLSIVTMLVAVFIGESAGAKELEYWSFFTKGEPYQIGLSNVISGFEKAHPGVKVKVVWAGRDVLTKMRPRVLMGNPPDLTDQAASELYAALVLSENALPLNDLLDEKVPDTNQKLRDVLKPNTWELFTTVEGKLYVIPYEVCVTAIWYNGRLFDKFGIAIPKTWDELIEICQILKNQGISPFAQDGTIDFYNAYWLTSVANRVLGRGAFHKAAHDYTGKAWDNPGWLESARKIEEISPRGKDFFEKGFEGSSWPSSQIGWARGETAMILMSSWLPVEVKNSAPKDFEFRCFPFPQVKGGKGSATDIEVFLSAFSVLKDAKNPELAKEFIKFALTKENQKKMIADVGSIPTRMGIPVDVSMEDANQMIINSTQSHRMYDGVQCDFPEWWMKVFLPLDDQLLFGKISAKDFLTQIKQKSVRFWEEKKAKGEEKRYVPLR
ncbi:hypothetical protein DRI96_05475 [Candidatus Aerophobetes bacterium]|uniref:Carbohydrate ABC transporter substrate-binding protein n=2 Tax=Aerophobetes bacterium TaxID=2030807 RepID=A0A662D8V3_UNCAE|nr:MAG: hypothetical protein DRI96_05475 [Candidatus Aerophobetes bacterium]